MTKKSVDIQVSGNLPAFANQTTFLANKNNKMQFIELLGKALQEVGHHVKYSQGDKKVTQELRPCRDPKFNFLPELGMAC